MKGSSSSVVNQSVLKGPHLSANSRSSSEDEFDCLVENWNGEISVDTDVVDTTRTKGGGEEKGPKEGNNTCIMV